MTKLVREALEDFLETPSIEDLVKRYEGNPRALFHRGLQNQSPGIIGKAMEMGAITSIVPDVVLQALKEKDEPWKYVEKHSWLTTAMRLGDLEFAKKAVEAGNKLNLPKFEKNPELAEQLVEKYGYDIVETYDKLDIGIKLKSKELTNSGLDDEQPITRHLIDNLTKGEQQFLREVLIDRDNLYNDVGNSLYVGAKLDMPELVEKGVRNGESTRQINFKNLGKESIQAIKKDLLLPPEYKVELARLAYQTGDDELLRQYREYLPDEIKRPRS